MANFNTPILFLIFNRLDTTERVFAEIKKIKPRFLFIAADGPRQSRKGEAEVCLQTKKIVLDNINWQCEVKTLFREDNLGCKVAVSSAIDWFFENVEEGIILEDDCLPDQSFFPYCEEMLNHYRSNERIFMISGDNFLPDNLRVKDSYYFSKIPHIWGWATWRRVWKLYDVKIISFPVFLEKNKIANIWSNKNVQKNWLNNFSEVYKNRIDTWDIQWTYCIWENDGICVIPNVNLISNIGFGAGATHTFNDTSGAANLLRGEIKLPLKHTFKVDLNYKADEYSNRHIFRINQNNYIFLKIIKKVMKKLRVYKSFLELIKFINKLK